MAPRGPVGSIPGGAGSGGRHTPCCSHPHQVCRCRGPWSGAQGHGDGSGRPSPGSADVLGSAGVWGLFSWGGLSREAGALLAASGIHWPGPFAAAPTSFGPGGGRKRHQACICQSTGRLAPAAPGRRPAGFAGWIFQQKTTSGRSTEMRPAARLFRTPAPEAPRPKRQYIPVPESPAAPRPPPTAARGLPHRIKDGWGRPPRGQERQR